MKENLFSQVVYFYASWCWQSLGKLPNPATGKEEKNLEMAEHAIDILDMLKTKTSGNLSSEEERLIEATLADMRINYLDELDKKEKDSMAEKAPDVPEGKDSGLDSDEDKDDKKREPEHGEEDTAEDR